MHQAILRTLRDLPFDSLILERGFSEDQVERIYGVYAEICNGLMEGAPKVRRMEDHVIFRTRLPMWCGWVRSLREQGMNEQLHVRH
jgi:hypothetical protein